MTQQAPQLNDTDLELLSAYIDGQTTDTERTALEARLEHEPALRRGLDELRTTVQLVNELPTERPPRSFTIDPATVKPRGFGLANWLRLGSALAAVLLAFTFTADFIRSGGSAAPAMAPQAAAATAAPAAAPQMAAAPTAAPAARAMPAATPAPPAAAGAAMTAAPAPAGAADTTMQNNEAGGDAGQQPTVLAPNAPLAESAPASNAEAVAATATPPIEAEKTTSEYSAFETPTAAAATVEPPDSPWRPIQYALGGLALALLVASVFVVRRK